MFEVVALIDEPNLYKVMEELYSWKNCIQIMEELYERTVFKLSCFGADSDMLCEEVGAVNQGEAL